MLPGINSLSNLRAKMVFSGIVGAVVAGVPTAFRLIALSKVYPHEAVAATCFFLTIAAT
ncbi:broad specificity polyphosphatase/5'/3'-nucleotidase SurE [Silvibacterium bohemicum]|uniref:5'-nucleotidase n=1 Tax=Silvibacterium bohemicum TaxID=1577686 RepID=A0A841JYY0_9BACT|nr:broad specificity polyphosphatase/5'/3'-nucleotidase SurE [Silvibacterium bohemicum]